VKAWLVQPEAGALGSVPFAPRLSAASCEVLRQIEIVDEQGSARLIHVPVERPLTVFLDDRELVTLMTLGASPELLVLGYLRNQRIVEDIAVIESITVDWAAGAALAKTRNGSPDGAADRAPAIISTGCALGTVFTDVMRRVDTIALAESSTARISQATLLRVLDTMRQYDAIHRAAGSVHSCALFHGAELWVSVEDVSRHNGVDTVAGWMALHGVAGGDKILFTTGRLTSEMIMKAAHNGIPIVISRNGVTAMGLDLAKRLGMTIFGRAAQRRFMCYAGLERFDAQPSDQPSRGSSSTDET
jgi:FdhD protein